MLGGYGLDGESHRETNLPKRRTKLQDSQSLMRIEATPQLSARARKPLPSQSSNQTIVINRNNSRNKILHMSATRLPIS